MKKRNVLNFAITGSLFAIFIVYTLLVKFVDVGAIGPNGSSVGFSTINGWVSEKIGVWLSLYTLTDYLSILVVLVALGFAILGLYQWIKRKSFKKIDKSILILGCFYILVFSAYLLFEFVKINYRPVLIDGVLETSYPSSTTMLVLCFMPTAIMQLSRLIKNNKIKITVNSLIAVFTAFMVIARIVSGVHWLTDIIGGIILSAGLVMLYVSVCNLPYFNENDK